MELVQYDSKYRQDFIDLNTAWIKNNFGSLEEEDIKTFQEIKLDDYQYVRGDIAFEYIVKSQDVCYFSRGGEV